MSLGFNSRSHAAAGKPPGSGGHGLKLHRVAYFKLCTDHPELVEQSVDVEG